VVPAGAAPPDALVWRDALAAELPPFMVPSAFLVLDALPLTANGKIDRHALAGTTAAPRPRPLTSATRAPSDLEHRIGTIWKELLGLREVGPDDDFFALGGDSLMAMRLLARIERDLGRRMTHAAFIEQPSIAAMARAVRGGSISELASLVPLQPHGTRPPLFCVHGGGGHCYLYRDLARRLGPDQPLWGLQGRHVEGRLPRQTSVEEMAAYYLEEIRHVAPEGPYYLAGASFGGKVALEMAQLLLRRGEAVGLVAMFDSWGPGYPAFRVNGLLRSAGWLYRRIEHHIGSVKLLDAGERRRYVLAKAAKTWRELGDLAQLLLARARDMRKPAEPPEADGGFIALASRQYRPSFYPGKVNLFRSKQQPLGIVEDRTLGWGGLVGELEIHDVVGLHAAVVAEPRVKHLVERFGPCLERAQAKHLSAGRTVGTGARAVPLRARS
jgi:thioesterase domain-containing protein